jgi:hypothetical protein
VTIPLLLALCDILDCQLTDLAVPVDPGKGQPKARKKATRKKAVGESPALPSSAVFPPPTALSIGQPSVETAPYRRRSTG